MNESRDNPQMAVIPMWHLSALIGAAEQVAQTLGISRIQTGPSPSKKHLTKVLRHYHQNLTEHRADRSLKGKLLT